MNLPNRLTVSRLFLTVAFVGVVSVQFPYHHTLSLILFLLAAITDFFDGEIARRYAMITDFGKLMDPLVDKIMTAAAFVCLVPLGAVPAWVAIIVIIREYLITGLRLLAISKGQILAADPIGKHKTSWQMATVIFFLVLLSIREFGNPSSQPSELWQRLWLYGGWTVSGVAMGLTIYSGLDYLWKHRAMIETE